MHESPGDIADLQELLDRSYERAGEHLRSIHTPDRLLRRETGSRAPDRDAAARAGHGHRGRPPDHVRGGRDLLPRLLPFRLEPDSVRFRHIRARPQVSATHLPGEELAVTVHGRATRVDVQAEAGAGFRQALLDVYVPRYCAEWEAFLDSGPVYARIDAGRMFALTIQPD